MDDLTAPHTGRAGSVMEAGSSEAGSESAAVVPLARLVHRLGRSGDELTMLAATLDYLQRFRPQGARLFALHLDAAGQPYASQAVAEWQDGQLPTRCPDSARRSPLGNESLVQRCLQTADLPLLVSAVAEREAVLHFGETPADCTALALLPLHSEGHGGWQGLLVLSWKEVHPFSAPERSTYELLMGVLAMHLGSWRAQRTLADARDEAALLQRVTEKLNVASNLEQALSALRLPAPSPAAAELVLCSIDTEADGTPGWLTIESMLTETDELVKTQLGTRYSLRDLPFSKLYLSSPGTPIFIGDIENDPRVDEQARRLYRVRGARATIVMALTLQGRWVGLFNATWRTPITFGERTQRLYLALAKQAALILDNSRMLGRLHAAFKETQEQSTLLRTVLDSIPVSVVLVDAATGENLLGNAWLDHMLGRPLIKKVAGAELVAAYQMVQPGTNLPFAAEDLPSQRAIKTAQTTTIEVDFLRPGNTRLCTEATAVPLCDATGAVKKIIILVVDLTARKRIEEERAQLQQDVIRVQAAALAERSSPLIPITDEILVLPLIGEIDTERGQQVLETVLSGSSERRARFTIIDITGVRTVDTQAAATLTKAALALRLLGVEPVLTGIRSEVAQTLVGLGVQLNEITTRSTLQSGIQYALGRLHKTSLDSGSSRR